MDGCLERESHPATCLLQNWRKNKRHGGENTRTGPNRVRNAGCELLSYKPGRAVQSCHFHLRSPSNMFPTGRWQEKKFPAFDTLIMHSDKMAGCKEGITTPYGGIKGACGGGTPTSHTSRCAAEWNLNLWYGTATGSPPQGLAQRSKQIRRRAPTTGQHDSIQDQ